jgi:plasmid stabilization system protein ParE
MRLTFHPQARAELNEAVDYYNSCRLDLGWDFAEEVEVAIQSIVAYPNAWAALSSHTRRCLVNRFPYGVIYQVLEREILILAIMQLNREPDYWRNRTTEP